MDIKWPPGLIADYVAKFCKQKIDTDGHENKIDTVITFDEGGVSGHCNHSAVYHGIVQLMEKRMVDVEAMTLSSVMLLRKYIGPIDANFVWIDEWCSFRWNVFEAYWTLAEHESQMVWFRKLFIVFSRYTYVNSMHRFVQHQPEANDNIVDENNQAAKPASKKKKVNIE